MSDQAVESLFSERLLAHASAFTFYPTGAKTGDHEVSHFAIRVSLRSEGKFAIVHMGNCWNGKTWEYETLPSSRTDEFLASTRFERDEATRQALILVDTMRLNGRTWVQWQEKFAANE